MHGQTSVSQPAKTYIHQLCTDTECSLEDLPGVMDYRDRWQERVKEPHAVDMTMICTHTYILVERFLWFET